MLTAYASVVRVLVRSCKVCWLLVLPQPSSYAANHSLTITAMWPIDPTPLTHMLLILLGYTHQGRCLHHPLGLNTPTVPTILLENTTLSAKGVLSIDASPRPSTHRVYRRSKRAFSNATITMTAQSCQTCTESSRTAFTVPSVGLPSTILLVALMSTSPLTGTADLPRASTSLAQIGSSSTTSSMSVMPSTILDTSSQYILSPTSEDRGSGQSQTPSGPVSVGTSTHPVGTGYSTELVISPSSLANLTTSAGYITSTEGTAYCPLCTISTLLSQSAAASSSNAFTTASALPVQPVTAFTLASSFPFPTFPSHQSQVDTQSRLLSSVTSTKVSSTDTDNSTWATTGAHSMLTLSSQTARVAHTTASAGTVSTCESPIIVGSSNTTLEALSSKIPISAPQPESTTLSYSIESSLTSSNISVSAIVSESSEPLLPTTTASTDSYLMPQSSAPSEDLSSALSSSSISFTTVSITTTVAGSLPTRTDSSSAYTFTTITMTSFEDDTISSLDTTASVTEPPSPFLTPSLFSTDVGFTPTVPPTPITQGLSSVIDTSTPPFSPSSTGNPLPALHSAAAASSGIGASPSVSGPATMDPVRAGTSISYSNGDAGTSAITIPRFTLGESDSLPTATPVSAVPI